MTFIAAWKNSWLESLAIFSAQQRKLFLLVTLKTILSSYKKLLTVLWPLLALYGAALYFFYASLPWVPLLPGLLLVSLVFLVVRPSVERKTFSYFFRYLVYDYEIIFLLMLMPYLIFSGVIAYWYTLFFIFFMFFVADGGVLWGQEHSFGKALYRTVLMILSNAPFLFLLHGFFILWWLLLTRLLGIPPIFLVGLTPVPLSFFMTVYIKRVHEQLNLYV